MRAYQHGAVMGLLYTVPVAVWIIAQGVLDWRQEGSVHMGMQVAIQALWFAQIVATSILISGVLAGLTLREQFTGAMAALLLPLPMLPLAWLVDAVRGTALLYGQIIVWGGCLLILLAVNGVRHFPLPTRLCTLSVVGVQVLAVTVAWRFRDTWLGWIGV